MVFDWMEIRTNVTAPKYDEENLELIDRKLQPWFEAEDDFFIFKSFQILLPKFMVDCYFATSGLVVGSLFCPKMREAKGIQT